MVRHPSVSQLKISEKLAILNERAIGMLTRIYNIKKVGLVEVLLLLTYPVIYSNYSNQQTRN